MTSSRRRGNVSNMSCVPSLIIRKESSGDDVSTVCSEQLGLLGCFGVMFVVVVKDDRQICFVMPDVPPTYTHRGVLPCIRNVQSCFMTPG